MVRPSDERQELLTKYDLSGKTIIPFFTHAGSSSGAGSLATIKAVYPNSTVLDDKSLSIRGTSVSSSEDAARDWVRGLDH